MCRRISSDRDATWWREPMGPLLCAPECEADTTAGLGRSLGKPQRRFEHYSRATTIVVNTRSLRHAVEMRTNDDQGAIAIKNRIGQHVSSEPLAGHGIDLEAHIGAVASCDFEGAAQFVCDAHPPNG